MICISLLILHKSLNNYAQRICNNQIQRSSQYVNYCQKYYTNSYLLNGAINFYGQHTDSRIFLYVDKVKNSVTSLQINVPQFSSFAIFGFTIKTEIQECEFKVEIEEDLIQTALICIQCNIIISHSTAQFIANGLSVSGLIMKASDVISIESCKIQFRTQAQLPAVVVLLISQQVKSFSISNVFISSHFQNYLDSNAVLVSQVENVQKLDIILSNVLYCDLNTNFIQSKHESIISFSQSPTNGCDLCESNEFMVYGICQNASLEFSENVNGVQICVFPFIYDGRSCICANEYYLNVDTCSLIINYDQYIVDNFTVINQRIALNTTVLESRIQNNMTAANKRMQDLSASIISNANSLSSLILSNKSYLEQIIIKNFAFQNNNIENNVTILQKQLGDFNKFNENIIKNFSYADSNLSRNTIELDKSIRANVSTLQNQISTLTVKENYNLATITNNLTSNKQYLETQIINNATKVNAAITSGIAPIRTDLTNVNSALSTLTTNLRNDLNWVNNDLNAKITAFTNNANWAQARINAVINDIGGLRAVDNSLQNQINKISNRVASVYWRVIQTPTGYYGAMVNTLQLCVNGDCRSM
ncbi:Growth_factor receptor cysteine-rich domain superfamily [Hexamita inflata]|uniref:Growth_factor receptor cysteine-rich domain superfamily n=1 Tax=Hexamita inflata TaxID=28002 RepID=A0ABP1KZJ5_9EUKA